MIMTMTTTIEEKKNDGRDRKREHTCTSGPRLNLVTGKKDEEVGLVPSDEAVEEQGTPVEVLRPLDSMLVSQLVYKKKKWWSVCWLVDNKMKAKGGREDMGDCQICHDVLGNASVM